ncbi:MAG: glucokinase [Deltaproteobacteria bacterium]
MPDASYDTILAGDIGGTKTILALYRVDGERLVCEREEKFVSGDYASFDEILGKFLAAGVPRLRAACFDVAGPVVDGECRPTNLPWFLVESSLRERLGGTPTRLLNDLEATAFGMLHLPAAEVVTLQAGIRAGAGGHVAVIAAGTGLGEAYLYWDGRDHHPMASEGGHADFAPRTDLEMELLAWLRDRLGGHVSSERILSGAGVHAIYDFLLDSGRGQEPAALAATMAGGDPAAAISRAAQEEKDPLAVAVMELFFELYGAEAGNMALRGLTHGGVFVGGGIAPKNLVFLHGTSFLRGFTAKGRFQSFMEGLHVRVALNPKTALLGASHFALRI